MRNLSDTIARLSSFRGLGAVEQDVRKSRLKDMVDFGSNPGALRARVHVPADLPARAPLVVALHGCTQTGGAYDRGSGWSDLADVQKFAVLYPEQLRSNNMNRCFNWFVPDDIRREGGEALSIRQMVAKLIVDHDLDPNRVFVTGLSAGGAMTAVMLATYPDVFAGGAVVAGIPYGAATTMSSAFDRMRGNGAFTSEALGALVKAASDHDGPWPTLSVWHGDADQTVDHSNAALLIDQWRALHDLPPEPAFTETIDGQPRRVWNDAYGRSVVEDFRIAGMGHGTPLDPAMAAGGGTSGPYMLDVGIASTRHIAAFWGLADASRSAKIVEPNAIKAATAAVEVLAKPVIKAKALKPAPSTVKAAKPVVDGVAKVIDDALRSAGLLR
jgi:poly(hydroxyalkanoate) depolymerase family esterase